jgi:ribonucleoside-diphosphate reductase alpha chain
MNNNMTMNVIKRNGKKEIVKMDKVLARIEKQCYGLDPNWVKPFEVAQKVIAGIYDGVTTVELDSLATETAASLTTKHSDFAILASRLKISALHKDTLKSFSDATQKLYDFVNPATNESAPLVSEQYYNIVMKNADLLNSSIVRARDFNFDIFGFMTLEKSYLLKCYNQKQKKFEIVETPQFLIMRVAIGIHGEDMESVIKTYELMSNGYFTHATPTLFNAGTKKPQLASCFLFQVYDDSIDGIYETLKQCAVISQNAGGIGISIGNIRATDSYIKGTGGRSNGIIPMLRVWNETSRYVDQGGNKRPGAIAMYLEPWHDDVLDFLDLKKNTGKEELRARDLFYAIWMNDLFMQRVEKDEMWSLMCPNECPGLQEAYAEDFVVLYTKYESEGKFRRQIKAREIWGKILDSQVETGTPYMLYKDSVNVKSNQKNIGTITNSNLCAEIVEFSSTVPQDRTKDKLKDPLDASGPEIGEVATCNLASICLPKFVTGKKNKKFDYDKLYDVTYQVILNLNKVVDNTYYPIEKTKNSNLRHRPLGLGVQGLADVFFLFGVPFASSEAKDLNKKIFETIYYASLKASNDLSKVDGSYESFKGSPASEGILQFDLWNVSPSKRYDWDALKNDIKEFGLRNSLTTCAMPTASTSSIFGNEASIEAQTSNLYSRRVLSGEFIIANKHLVKELCDLGLWSDEIRNKIIINNGSIQTINEIPQNVRDVYKTVWEISQKDIIDMSADRGAFIDQTQSLNIFMPNPNVAKLTSMHFHGWGGGVTKDLSENPDPKYGSTPEKALKTGMYYLRGKSAANAVKFTAKAVEEEKVEYTVEEQIVCSIDNKDDCLACGS